MPGRWAVPLIEYILNTHTHTLLFLSFFRSSSLALLSPSSISLSHLLFFFPTLTVGLLDFKVDVVLARLQADFRDQPPSIPAVPNHQVSLQCPTAEYPCGAQPPSIPAMPNHQVSLQCPTAEYVCSAQPQSIPLVPNRRVCLQCPTAEYPYTAQLQSIPAVLNH